MELELQDNSNIDFQNNIEIYKTPNNNKHFHCTNYLILLFMLSSFIFLFFTKNNEYKKIILPRLNNELPKEKHIDSDYVRVSPNDENYVYIPIVGTNDFHGRFFPQINTMKLGPKEIEYKTGGLEYIAKYINILREEFGNNRVLYFDTGDKYFLSNETVLFDGRNIQEFLNKIGLNGSVLGNNEFLYKR